MLLKLAVRRSRRALTTLPALYLLFSPVESTVQHFSFCRSKMRTDIKLPSFWAARWAGNDCVSRCVYGLQEVVHTLAHRSISLIQRRRGLEAMLGFPLSLCPLVYRLASAGSLALFKHPPLFLVFFFSFLLGQHRCPPPTHFLLLLFPCLIFVSRQFDTLPANGWSLFLLLLLFRHFSFFLDPPFSLLASSPELGRWSV